MTAAQIKAGWQLALPGSQAQVRTIAASTRFEMPQQLAVDAAVANRINRQLLCYARAEYNTVDSAASPRRQLSQAERKCCS